MARKCGAIFYLLNGCVQRAAPLMAEHKDQRCTEYAHSILKTGDRIRISKIACYAANEDIAATGIEGIFGSDPGVGATENTGKRVLSSCQGGSFRGEVMTPHGTLDITVVSLHEAIQ